MLIVFLTRARVRVEHVHTEREWEDLQDPVCMQVSLTFLFHVSSFIPPRRQPVLH